MERRVLVLMAHPTLETSRVNKRLAAVASEVAGVTLHDLYETYPEFDVEVDDEQARLVEHDVVVLQHPLFWYSVPALLKQWIDLVLEHGWAYGSGGRSLEGKLLVNAVTTGAPEGAYQPSGLNKHTLRELLLPIELTARLCLMKYEAPFAVYGAHVFEDREIEEQAVRYREWLEGLVDRNGNGSGHAR